MTTGTMRVRPRRRRSRGPVALLVLTCVVALSLTFLLGVLVGRGYRVGGRVPMPQAWVGARTQPQAAEVEKGKRAPIAGRGAVEDRELRRRAQIQERLTFYHTLTAPHPATPRPAPKPREATAEAGEGDRGPGESDRNEGEAATGMADGRAPVLSWTVQVAAYRSVDSATALQSSLAASGYDAYVVPSAGEEGTVRYRVRVGSYPSRTEAAKIAERLRSERALAAFVVSR
ncbi:MAG: SPOR domain-containing protein [Candidatus Rokubacteria bacterium]|nr:SPOR domain-containing protein [Candidatus Rokubacteria bacterium]